jgi:hypothetical protein
MAIVIHPHKPLPSFVRSEPASLAASEPAQRNELRNGFDG